MRNGFGMTLTLIALLIPLVVAQPVPECADGVDNDNDGGTDWLGTANDPNAPYEDWDQDCTWPADPSEGGYGPYPCAHFSPHSHTYGGSSPSGTTLALHGVVVFDTNTADCDGDGLKDFDGDYDSGVGGGFFGYGPWANEPTCNYGLHTHGGTVVVNDVVFGSDIWFVIGADDTSGPSISVDPVTGETTCETDGSITPGDPTTDPTADADDCLTGVYTGSGSTCGAGGDGGYWTFLTSIPCRVTYSPPGIRCDWLEQLWLGNPPTAGTITA